jgi:two-component system, chemotaxis family, chemotaxis protein CheY
MKVRSDIVQSINQKKPEGLNKFDKPYRALVVDDSTTMRRIVGQQLRSEAYDICGEAADGAQALELYKEFEPDIVTLDINMPNVSGLEALKSILSWDKNAKIVMLTSEGQKETVLEAISNGAKGYVVKPPNKTKLCTAVKKALSE